MTEREERELRRQVLKKLRLTGRNETACLAYWEITILLDYIRKLIERGGDS